MMVCGMLSWFVQVTVAAAGTVNVFGEKLKLSMTTSVSVVLGGVDSLLSESLPCVLLRSASATSMTNARVPVFTCLINGVSTVTHLVAGFRWGIGKGDITCGVSMFRFLNWQFVNCFH